MNVRKIYMYTNEYMERRQLHRHLACVCACVCVCVCVRMCVCAILTLLRRVAACCSMLQRVSVHIFLSIYIHMCECCSACCSALCSMCCNMCCNMLYCMNFLCICIRMYECFHAHTHVCIFLGGNRLTILPTLGHFVQCVVNISHVHIEVCIHRLHFTCTWT